MVMYFILLYTLFLNIYILSAALEIAFDAFKDSSLNFKSDKYKGKIFNLVEDFEINEDQKFVVSNIKSKDPPITCILPTCQKSAKLYNLCSDHNKNVLDKAIITFRKAGLFSNKNKREVIEMIMERNDNNDDN